MKKYEVVGVGTYCGDEEYIQCSVINQWDFQTKCTAMGKVCKETLRYNFIKYTRKETIAYNGKRVECYEPNEIKNPKDYPEIMDYCKRNNIQICYELKCINKEKSGISTGIVEQIDIESKYTILGNIHENPELLEAK